MTSLPCASHGHKPAGPENDRAPIQPARQPDPVAKLRDIGRTAAALTAIAARIRGYARAAELHAERDIVHHNDDGHNPAQDIAEAVGSEGRGVAWLLDRAAEQLDRRTNNRMADELAEEVAGTLPVPPAGPFDAIDRGPFLAKCVALADVAERLLTDPRVSDAARAEVEPAAALVRSWAGFVSSFTIPGRHPVNSPALAAWPWQV